MALHHWKDDGTDFGTARAFDTVATDIYCRLAHRFGATITAGHLPADIEAEQPERREAAERHYGDRASHLKPREPFAVFTISHDGLTLSGDHVDGHSSTRGYRGHYWQDRIGPKTVVVDLRTVPEERIVRFAVSGPMLGVSLPDGTLSRVI